MSLLKQLKQKWSRKSESKSLNNYYTSIIDIPIWNWWQVIETKDLKFILKNKEFTLCKASTIAFEALQEDFIKHFGVDDRYKKYIKLRCDIELKYIEQVLTGDFSNQLIINMLENELNLNFEQETKSNYFGVVVALEKWGIKVDIMTCTVYVFYNYLNELKKWQKVKR